MIGQPPHQSYIKQQQSLFLCLVDLYDNSFTLIFCLVLLISRSVVVIYYGFSCYFWLRYALSVIRLMVEHALTLLSDLLLLDTVLGVASDCNLQLFTYT